MSASLREAFGAILTKVQRPISLKRFASGAKPQVSVSTFMSPSNYSRYLAGPGDTKISGYEFILTIDNLKASGFPLPVKIADRIIDSELGELVIKEYDAIWGLGGEIFGYRVRTG